MGKNKAGPVWQFLNREGLTEKHLTFEQQLMKYVDIREIMNVPDKGRTCAKALRWEPVTY